MKKLLLSIITLSSISFLSAQEIKFGAKAGLNLSTVKYEVPEVSLNGFDAAGEEQDNQFKVGFHVGGFAEFVISDQFSFQPELLFSLQGSKLERNDIEEQNFFDGSSIRTVANTTTDLTTSYINIPLMAKYYVSEKLFLVAGPQVGFLVGAKSKSEGTGTSTYTLSDGSTTTSNTVVNSESVDTKESFKSYNISVGAGGGYFFTENIFAEARYNLGLTNDSQSIPFFNITPKAKASAIQISLGYRF